jgi:hypothetical protein
MTPQYPTTIDFSTYSDATSFDVQAYKSSGASSSVSPARCLRLSLNPRCRTGQWVSPKQVLWQCVLKFFDARGAHGYIGIDDKERIASGWVDRSDRLAREYTWIAASSAGVSTRYPGNSAIWKIDFPWKP